MARKDLARKDALLRLHQRLLAKREALRRKLIEDLNLSDVGHSGSDLGDAAADGAHSELYSQLAAMESRELRQIEKAIELIREGRYGLCEICDHAIPITRLKALPFTPVCVECQRKQEEMGLDGNEFDADWETACEFEGKSSDAELTLGDLDLDS